MKITSIEKAAQVFNDGSKSKNLLKISFDNTGIKKAIQVTLTKSGSTEMTELIWLLRRAKVEAMRDDLYTKYGKDWREHDEKIVLLEEEKRLLADCLGIV